MTRVAEKNCDTPAARIRNFKNWNIVINRPAGRTAIVRKGSLCLQHIQAAWLEVSQSCTDDICHFLHEFQNIGLNLSGKFREELKRMKPCPAAPRGQCECARH